MNEYTASQAKTGRSRPQLPRPRNGWVPGNHQPHGTQNKAALDGLVQLARELDPRFVLALPMVF
jgi:hypothetical protein